MDRAHFFGCWLPMRPAKGYTFRIWKKDQSVETGVIGITPINDKLISLHFGDHVCEEYRTLKIEDIVELVEHRSNAPKKKGRKGGRKL